MWNGRIRWTGIVIYRETIIACVWSNYGFETFCSRIIIEKTSEQNVCEWRECVWRMIWYVRTERSGWIAKCLNSHFWVVVRWLWLVAFMCHFVHLVSVSLLFACEWQLISHWCWYVSGRSSCWQLACKFSIFHCCSGIEKTEDNEELPWCPLDFLLNRCGVLTSQPPPKHAFLRRS